MISREGSNRYFFRLYELRRMETIIMLMQAVENNSQCNLRSCSVYHVLSKYESPFVCTVEGLYFNALLKSFITAF